MSLRGDAQALHPGGDTTTVPHLNPGDLVLAYDFDYRIFLPARVRRVLDGGDHMVHRFHHAYGILQCTRSHKVCALCENGKHELIRVMRAYQHRRPVVVRTPQGAPAFSMLDYGGEILEEPTWVVEIDHPNHSLVCDGIAVSES